MHTMLLTLHKTIAIIQDTKKEKQIKFAYVLIHHNLTVLIKLFMIHYINL
jgi:hypothetical protein